jgi:hypothetical protein
MLVTCGACGGSGYVPGGNPTAYEARCEDCGETFNPYSPDDMTHVERANGDPCGGDGYMVGVWYSVPVCQWFALCDNEAVGTVGHPVLGDVPTCQRCADTHGLALTPVAAMNPTG